MALPGTSPKLDYLLVTLRDPEPATDDSNAGLFASLKELQRYSKDLRILLEEGMGSISSVTNFAGQLRFDVDPTPMVYRYHDAAGLWISDVRAVFPWGMDVVVNGVQPLRNAGYATMAVGAGGSSYPMPQDGVFTRWGADWGGVGLVNDAFSLNNGAHIWTASVVSSQFQENLLALKLTFVAGEKPRCFVTRQVGSTMAQIAGWYEVAWTKTFES